MRLLRTFGYSFGALVLMSTAALAVPVTPAFTWTGMYVGINGGFYGGSSGVMTLDGTIGAKFDGFGGWGGGNIYTGLEGSIGIQTPSSGFELWGYGKAGPELREGTWLYGLGGLGLVDTTPAWAVGVGIEQQLTSRFSVYGEGLIRGALGSSSPELGFRFGAHYALTPSDFDARPGLSGMSGPDLSGLFGASSHQFYIGGSVGFVGSSSASIIPSVEFGVNCMHAADLELGVRGRIGMQLGTGYLEAFGGVTAGKSINDQFKLYGFGELGHINSYFIQSLGIGVEYKLSDSIGLYGEGFERGAIGGSSIELGARMGARWYFDSPPPP